MHTNKKIDSMELSGEMKLVAAILRMAKRDLRSSSGPIRGEARAFWRGHRQSVWWWCDLLGLDPESVERWVSSRDP
jgi:hypothetical protein